MDSEVEGTGIYRFVHGTFLHIHVKSKCFVPESTSVTKQGNHPSLHDAVAFHGMALRNKQCDVLFLW